MQMANTIFGDGVRVVSASYTGDSRSSAIYSNGDSTSPEATPSNTGVILSTGRADDFTNSSSWFNSDPNQSASTSTNTRGVDNNAQFNAAVGTNTYDASWLDVDFVPDGNVMTVSFVFASEEYPEYAGSIYNDMFVVWVNGAPVDLSIGNGDTSVTNVSGINNMNLYVSNTGDQYNTEMDGFTITMTLTLPVNPGELNSVRFGIADVTDSNYDSSVLIAADSVQTMLVAGDDVVNMFPDQTRTFDVLSNDVNNTGGTLTITAINGVPVSVGDTVTLPSGEQVTLNADGTLTFVTDSDGDSVSLTYEVTSSTGATDVGFITIGTVPCFVAGTMIATQDGLRPIETLQPGDLVLTEDDGPQPLRWIGTRTVAAQDNFAPIEISANTFGAHGALRLSPQHRILMRDPLAEMLFGNTEVLIAAKDLVNGTSVRVAAGGDVTYVHILFDRHQVVRAEGLATESFLPGPQALGAMEEAVQNEIFALFPDLAATPESYPAARPMLRSFEAQLLRGSKAA